MTPLEQYPQIRRWVYSALWLVGLVLVGAQVGVAAIPEAVQPAWLTVALAVYPAVGAYVGFQAKQNTTPPSEGIEVPADGRLYDVDLDAGTVTRVEDDLT